MSISLLKDWKLFWNVSDGGKKLNDDIINKYPLQVAGFLREPIELGGLGYTDTSYLSRNKSKSDKMMAIKDKYNLNMQDINVMFSKQDESHKAWIRDALLMGKNVPVDVLKDYPDLALRYGQKKESPEYKIDQEDLQSRVDDYKALSQKEREKYKENLMNNVISLKADLEKQTDEKAKEIYNNTLNFHDETFKKIQEIDRQDNVPILKQSDEQFLEGNWKFGGKRKDIVDAWESQAMERVGAKKQFKTKEDAVKEISNMAKNVKGIDDERYRVLKMVADKLSGK